MNDNSDPLHESPWENIFDAAAKGSVEDVRFFVEKKGVDVNAKDQRGSTPLLLTVWRRRSPNLEVVRYWLEHGADVDAKDNYGRTPLHHAAGNSNIEIVKYLVERGADANAESKAGETPLQMATKQNNSDVVRFLGRLVAEQFNRPLD